MGFGRCAPLCIAMVAVALVRCRRSTVRREPCLPEDPSQVDDQLLVDVFPTGALEHFGFGPKATLNLPLRSSVVVPRFSSSDRT